MTKTFVIINKRSPEMLNSFSENGSVEIFTSAYKAFEFIEKMIKEEVKHFYEVREFRFHSSCIGKSLGGV